MVPVDAASVPTALVSRATDGTKADAANLPGGDGSTFQVYRHGPR